MNCHWWSCSPAETAPNPPAPVARSGSTEKWRKTSLAGAHRALDQRVDHVELPLGALPALQVVEDLDGDGRVLAAEAVAELPDPSDESLHLARAGDLDVLLLAVVEREGDDHEQGDDRDGGEDQHPGHSGPPAARSGPPAARLLGQPASAL